MKKYYIASCLFTARFPELSLRVQAYLKTKPEIEIVRCCLPKFRVTENAERIPDKRTRKAWLSLTPWAEWQPGDIAYSICHNCTNIIEEQHAGVKAISLWELIDQDPSFPFPDESGLTVTVQDCWRSRERRAEQEAVRHLLRKMRIEYMEREENFERTNFCGSTLYREQPAKNARFAPKHYVEQAQGKFLPHSEEEQVSIMQDYCRQFKTKTVVCYCHYCLEGLLQGGVDGRHLAQLLFPARA